MNGKTGRHGGTSLWSTPGVPHKAWREVGRADVRDLGARDLSEYATCDMCGRNGIRFLRQMVHTDYPTVLHVGRGCAAKMAQPKLENAVAIIVPPTRLDWSTSPSSPR